MILIEAMSRGKIETGFSFGVIAGWGGFRFIMVTHTATLRMNESLTIIAARVWCVA
jgi:hypothetical protein